MAKSAGPIQLPMWYRTLAAVVGAISIVLAIVVLVDPALGLFLLVFLLAFALLVIGIDRLVTGVTGHLYGWTGGPFGPGFPGGPGAASAPPSGGPDPPTKP